MISKYKSLLFIVTPAWFTEPRRSS